MIPATPRRLKKWRKLVPLTLTGRDYVRELVRIRDKHTCQTCGIIWMLGKRRFDVHHLFGLCGKKSRGYDRIKDMDTLITLCHPCHYKDHHFSQNYKPES